MSTIGFIGTGIMGRHMARHLQDGGHELLFCPHRTPIPGELLHGSGLNYIGYVEGDDVYKGGADVVVVDGFVGNVALKSSEGVAKMVRHYIQQEFGRNWLSKLAGLVALPVMKRFGRSIDPRRYNGASLVGLRGVVIKSHGGADRLAFANAIGIAKKEIHADVQDRIQQRVETLLVQREAS